MVASASDALCTCIAMARSIAVNHDQRLAVEVFLGVLDAASGPKGTVLDRVVHGELIEVLLAAEVGLYRIWKIPKGEYRAREPAAAQEVEHVPHKGTVAERN